MFSAGFVVSIINELGEHVKDNHGIIKLPLGSEYKIRLRNRNHRDALAIVKIDGKNISEEGFVILANAYADIERPVNDDRKFKLVSSSSKAAEHAGKVEGLDENGVIEVEWRLRRPEYTIPDVRKPIVPWTNPYRYNDIKLYDCDEHQRSVNDLKCSFSSNKCSSASFEGVTVGGSHSDQKFRTVNFEIDHSFQPVLMRLTIRGTKEKVVFKSKYCSDCGARLKETYRFCSSCGCSTRTSRNPVKTY